MFSELSNQKLKSDSSWEFLQGFNKIGPNSFQHIVLSSGIEMLSMDYLAGTTSKQSFCINRAPIAFSFHLSGHGQSLISHSLTGKKHVSGEPGRALISFNPESNCQTEIVQHQHYRILNIYISPEQLYENLCEELDQVPRDLHSILDKGELSPCNLAVNISPHTKILLDQISNCPYKGILKRLYLESKSVELIVRQLWEVTQNHNNTQQCIRCLHPADRDRIHHAKEILISNLANPPSIKVLAKKAGLNETKLKTGFRQLYGSTVFEFFRTYRLAKAKKLLDKGLLNVDETAHLLGFCDTTHFIKSFKNHFHTTPGAYLKNNTTC